MIIDDRAATEALRASFERYYAELVRLPFLLADERSLAEDVEQDAFVRSARRLAELAEDARLPYLRAAVVNHIHNLVSKLRLNEERRGSKGELSSGAGVRGPHRPDPIELEDGDVVEILTYATKNHL